MTLSINDFQNATLGGVPFFWVDDNTTFGRKKISYEYPDRDTRFVEDQGLLPEKFSITARVFYTESFTTRDAFEEMLSTVGNKELTLPVSKDTYLVAIMPSMAKNSRTHLGYTEYSLTLEKAQSNQFPITTNTSVGFIERLKDRLFGENAEALTNSYLSVKNKVIQIKKLTTKIQKTGDKLQRVARNVVNASDGLTDFIGSINTLTGNAVLLAQSPAQLAGNLSNTFQSLESVSTNSQTLFDVVKGYFNFSSGDQQSIGVSSNEKIVSNNQELINSYISSIALAQGYVFASSIAYSNFNDLNNTRDLLESSFNTIQASLDEDVLETLQNIRINANKIFDNLQVSLPTIETINVAKQPLVPFVYQLYGSLDNLDLINDLNTFPDPSQIEGNIKVLSTT